MLKSVGLPSFKCNDRYKAIEAKQVSGGFPVKKYRFDIFPF
jgi:hypothetical protein